MGEVTAVGDLKEFGCAHSTIVGVVSVVGPLVGSKRSGETGENSGTLAVVRSSKLAIPANLRWSLVSIDRTENHVIALRKNNSTRPSLRAVSGCIPRESL